MAQLREIELEFVDIIVMSDIEPALTSLIESWSTMKINEEWIEDDHREPSCWKIDR